MQHFTQLSDIHLGKTWLTIGSFDGVHLGHQYLIKQLVQGAHANGASAVVLTFHPHPAVVLRGMNDPFYLTSQDEKRDLMAVLGLDACLSLEFNLELASFTAQYFLELLIRQMRLDKLVIGQGFALGRGRTGDAVLLERIGTSMGFTLEVIKPVKVGDTLASSSHIRQSLIQHNLQSAARMLGRNYSLEGIVSHGDGRGRSIGFPTANIATARQRLLPGNGVYACMVKVDGRNYKAVANIGVRPTFSSTEPSPHLEAHLLDFDREIYGELIKVEFIQFLRVEQKFSSVEALTGQIKLDICSALEILS